MDKDIGTILLVDDNPDDYEATFRGLRKNHLLNPVAWCQSGQEARDYLYREGKYQADESVTRPMMILLDLNMPGLDGRELLGIIKQHQALKSIPVVVLTTSKDPRDIDECYALGASTYIQKPVSFEGLTQAIKTMKDYWFGIAVLPSYEQKEQ